jgi:hypothetical protein
MIFMTLKDINAEKTELEILLERAEVLGRAGDRLSQALKNLECLDQVIRKKLDAGVSESEMTEKKFLGSSKRPVDRSQQRELLREINNEIRRYNEAREFAKLRLYYLIVTREAVGFRRHKSVDEQYPIPPKKKLIKSFL